MTSRPGGRRRSWPPPARRLAAVAAGFLALLATACGAAASPAAPARTASPDTRVFGDPYNPLFTGSAQLATEHQAAGAAALLALARTPAALWAAGQPNEMQQVRHTTQAAAKAREVPVIVAYDLPDRDACGKFSGSAGAGEGAYEKYVSELAAAIGGGDVIVIVEPDALPDIVSGCLTPTEGSERYKLLRYAMSHLAGLPHTRVYLDAGNPGMFADPARLAGPLKKAGIQYGRGFSANVSNFQSTSTVAAWSQQLEHALGGGLRAVIDTSRNGNGPYLGSDSPQWCNPPGRAPGPAPTLDPGRPGISAYLWIKDPGVSDGPCNGGPAAGQFWAKYALALAHAGHFS